jgi:hypothetical protein
LWPLGSTTEEQRQSVFTTTTKNPKERVLGRILEYEDVYWTHLAQDRVIWSTWGGACEHVNKPSDSVEGTDFLTQLRDY